MNKDIIMYGADWCKDCIRSKEILEERNIDYTFLDITDPSKGKEYSDIVMDLNDGKRIIPTLIINDEYYPNPKASELHILLNGYEADTTSNVTTCSNGKELFDGDSVLLTRDLDVKGSSLNLKQGTQIDKIKLTGNSAYIDCRIGKSTLAIKTEFIKKKG